MLSACSNIEINSTIIVTMKNTYIHSFARALPTREVKNSDLEKLMDTSDKWITKRSGIKTRYWVDEGTTTSDLAAQAAKESLALYKEKAAVDAIVAATLSPDYNFPGIGVQIQDKMKLGQIPAYDIRNQCSGFLYGLEMSHALIANETYKSLLLVGAEVHSTGLDKTTRGRDIAVLFGDGAGSCVLSSEPVKENCFEFIDSELHSDGSFASELWCEHPGSAPYPSRLTVEMVEQGKCYPHMNGKLVFEHAVRAMTEVSRSILKKNGLSSGDISLFVPHQANIRINKMVGDMLELERSQVFNTISEYGNTTAATIPIGLSRAVSERSFSPGEYVLSAAFGSGFTWGAVLLKVY